tara:strand:- start:1318 stop:2229 length:912 start_codon:yes stop_codon:yes gene_type:complete
MSFIGVGIGLAVIGGGVKLGMSLSGRTARRDEQRAARDEMNQLKQEYENLDTSNLAANVRNQFENMENAYEDMTVNQQQARFEAQQAEQQRINTMQALQGAAGGSGIGALAQALANQGQIATQRASASIGAQESQIQKLRAAEASRLQLAERQGEVQAQAARLAGAETARGLEYSKTGTLLGMSQQRLGAANQAIAEAKAQQMSAIGDLASAGTQIATAGINTAQLDPGKYQQRLSASTGLGGANMRMSIPEGTSASGAPLTVPVMTPTGGEISTGGAQYNYGSGLGGTSIIGFNADGSPIYG